MAENEPEIDRLARILALNAGLEWDRLGNYPGYLRNLWREQARAMLASLATPAADRMQNAPPRPAA